MLRMLVSHGIKPPLRNVIGGLVAYLKICDCLGCIDEAVAVSELVEKLQEIIHLANSRTTPQTENGAGHEVGRCTLPQGAVRGAAIITIFHHVQASFRDCCQQVDPKRMSELKASRKKSRPLEMKDFLTEMSHFPDAKKDPKLFSKLHRALEKFRNQLFHTPNSLPSGDDVKCFWEAFTLLATKMSLDPQREGRAHVARLMGNDVVKTTRGTKAPAYLSVMVRGSKQSDQADSSTEEEEGEEDPIEENKKKEKNDGEEHDERGEEEEEEEEKEEEDEDDKDKGKEIGNIESDADIDDGKKSEQTDDEGTRSKSKSSAKTTNWIVGASDDLEGRDGEIEKVMNTLKQPANVLIWGEPGMGKTVLASACAFRLRTDYPDQNFFCCTTEETFRNDILQFAISNGFSPPKNNQADQHSSEEKDAFEWTSAFLRRTHRRLLLVFDDLRQASLLRRLRIPVRHSVLITSFHRHDDRMGVRFGLELHLQALDTMDSLKVIANIRSGANRAAKKKLKMDWPNMLDHKDWLKLVQKDGLSVDSPRLQLEMLVDLVCNKLNNLPLAVDMVGRLLAKDLSIIEVVNQFRVQFATLSDQSRMETLEEEAANSSHALAISGLGLMALALVKQHKDAQLYEDLALAIACCSCPRVPVNVLGQGAQSQHEILQHLFVLKSVGLISVSECKQYAYMHSLMQKLLMNQFACKPETRQRWPAVFDFLCTNFHRELNSSSGPQLPIKVRREIKNTAALSGRKLFDFAIAMARVTRNVDREKIPQHGISQEQARLLEHQFFSLGMSLGQYHGNARENPTADLLAGKDVLRTLSSLEKRFNLLLNCSEQASLCFWQGNVALHLGCYKDAKVNFQSSLYFISQNRGSNSEKNQAMFADITHNLGHVALKLGQFEEAKLHFEHALNIKRQHYGDDHVELAVTIHQLGRVALDLGQLEEAKLRFEHALNIQRQHYGDDHVELATTIHNLGNVALDLGQFEEAKLRFEHALNIQRQHYDDDHVELAATIHELGRVALYLGQLEEAKLRFEHALNIQRQHYGDDHVELATTIHNLGNVALDLGQFEEAKLRFEHALNIERQHYGDDHVELAATIHQLGRVALDLGQLEEAKLRFEHALNIQRQHYGDDHVELATTIHNLGNVALDLGQFEEAKLRFEHALNIQRQHYSDDHVELAATIHELGRVAFVLGQFEEAKLRFEHALNIERQHYGDDHVELAATIHNLGSVALDLGQFEEAKLRFEHALNIKRQHYGDDHVELAATIHELGRVALDLGQLEEAKLRFEHALNIQRQHYGDDHVELATTIHNLGNVA